MASTAAWSAAFSSPRPIHFELASAAASVIRTNSSAKLRSIFQFLRTLACNNSVQQLRAIFSGEFYAEKIDSVIMFRASWPGFVPWLFRVHFCENRGQLHW